MAYRTGAVLKVQSTSVPQPLFGSWITAGIGGPTDVPITITLGTECNAGNDASQLFQGNEPAVIIDPNGANSEVVLVGKVSGNTLVLNSNTGLGNHVTANPHISGAFGTGSFIIPKQIMNNFLVQYEDGATGQWLYLGNQYNMTAVFKRFFKLAKAAANVQPQFYSSAMFSPGNPFDLSELWVLGTTVADLYNVSINVD